MPYVLDIIHYILWISKCKLDTKKNGRAEMSFSFLGIQQTNNGILTREV